MNTIDPTDQGRWVGTAAPLIELQSPAVTVVTSSRRKAPAFQPGDISEGLNLFSRDAGR